MRNISRDGGMSECWDVEMRESSEFRNREMREYRRTEEWIRRMSNEGDRKGV